jgi:hypothetical protein
LVKGSTVKAVFMLSVPAARRAHATRVLQCKVGALAGPQEGFGHHLGGVAAARQGVGGFAAGHAVLRVGPLAGHAHQAQGLAGGADGDGLLGATWLA